MTPDEPRPLDKAALTSGAVVILGFAAQAWLSPRGDSAPYGLYGWLGIATGALIYSCYAIRHLFRR